MKGDRIEIEDEWYLDTTAAAEKTGYTKDYIGQLARAGKVQARQLGRAWYVHEASLLAHKKDVHVEKSTTLKPSRSRIVQKKEKNDASNFAHVKVSTHIPSLKEKSIAHGAHTDAVQECVPVEVKKEAKFDGVVHASVTVGVQKKADSSVPVSAHNPVSAVRDPLMHANISFHSDGPVNYTPSSEPLLPTLQKTSQEEPVFVTPYAAADGVLGTPARDVADSVVCGGVADDTRRMSVLMWCTYIPYTVAIVSGSSVACVVMLFTLV
jgi:hypothetical protein